MRREDGAIRWRMWAGVLTVFVCGLVIGAVGGSIYEREAASWRFDKIRNRGGEFLTEISLDRLEHLLDLTPEQVAGIRPILERGFQRGHELQHALRPQMDKVLEETAEEIKPLLTPPQKKGLEREGGWRALLPRLPPPPPRGGPAGPDDGPPPPPHGFPPPPGPLPR